MTSSTLRATEDDLKGIGPLNNVDQGNNGRRSSQSTRTALLSRLNVMPTKSNTVLPFAPERLSITREMMTPAMAQALANAGLEMEKKNRSNTNANVNTLFAATKMKRALQRARAGKSAVAPAKIDEAQVIIERHDKVLSRYKIRTVKSDDEDEEKNRHFGFLMVNPCSTMYKMWQLSTLLLIIYQTLALPYSLAFNNGSDNNEGGDLVTNCIFALDIIIQFNTPISRDTEVATEYITDRRVIAKTYATGWLLFDLLACMPFDQILQAVYSIKSTNNLNVLGLLKALRVPRLLRLFRLLRVVKILRIRPELRRWLQYSRHANLLRLVRLVCSFLVLNHFLACIWYGAVADPRTLDAIDSLDSIDLSMSSKDLVLRTSSLSSNVTDYLMEVVKTTGINSNLAVDLVLHDTADSASRLVDVVIRSSTFNKTLCSIELFLRKNVFSDGIDSDIVVALSSLSLNTSSQALRDPKHMYFVSFYTSLLLVMGQNIQLISKSEYVFSIIVLLFGAVLMAIVFGNVAILIANFYENQSSHQKKMEWLFASMNRMKLPNDLQNRINDYYQMMWERHGTLDGAVTAFIPELSRNLAYEVELFLRMDMINRAPIFQSCSAKVVQELVMQLELQVFMPGDYVVVRGEVGNDMYFVQSGVCEVTKDVVNPTNQIKGSNGEKNSKEIILKTLGQGDYFGEIALLMNCKRTANVRVQIFSELCTLTREVFETISIRYLEDRSIIEKFIIDKYDPGMLQAALKQSVELSVRNNPVEMRGLDQQRPNQLDGNGLESKLFDLLKKLDDRMIRLENKLDLEAQAKRDGYNDIISNPVEGPGRLSMSHTGSIHGKRDFINVELEANSRTKVIYNTESSKHNQKYKQRSPLRFAPGITEDDLDHSALRRKRRVSLSRGSRGGRRNSIAEGSFRIEGSNSTISDGLLTAVLAVTDDSHIKSDMTSTTFEQHEGIAASTLDKLVANLAIQERHDTNDTHPSEDIKKRKLN